MGAFIYWFHNYFNIIQSHGKITKIRFRGERVLVILLCFLSMHRQTLVDAEIIIKPVNCKIKPWSPCICDFDKSTNYCLDLIVGAGDIYFPTVAWSCVFSPSMALTPRWIINTFLFQSTNICWRRGPIFSSFHGWFYLITTCLRNVSPDYPQWDI